MSIFCPVKEGPALYAECLECDEKVCKNSFFCGCVFKENVTYNQVEEAIKKATKNETSIILVTDKVNHVLQKYAYDNDYILVVLKEYSVPDCIKQVANGTVITL